jgi:hypothetical protein
VVTIITIQVRLAALSKGIKYDMRLLPRSFASYVRQSVRIEAEIVDLLEGRVPTTLYAKHYSHLAWIIILFTISASSLFA